MGTSLLLGILRRECLLTRLPHLKCIRLGYVGSSHLAFKMHYVGYVRSILHILMYIGSIETRFKDFFLVFITYSMGAVKSNSQLLQIEEFAIGD